MTGIVQGVGFRPFVSQFARGHGLAGSVCNDGHGVTLVVEGAAAAVERFLHGLRSAAPPLARIEQMTVTEQAVQGEAGFTIQASRATGEKTAAAAPDAHLCDDCLRELFEPTDRRYRYPFINCTNCGPRFSLITAIPYDRPQTTMADFPLCSACRDEYTDPASRRFHAEPIACPDCGPRLTLRDHAGRELAGDPLAATIALLHQGQIVAIKGIGGYHLAVDARQDAAVAELRRRKVRDEKPFALMVADLEAARRLAVVNAAEAGFLTSVERPIVLLEQRPEHGLSAGIAPRNRYLGVMLAYAPLHHLLLREGAFPALVMTSGNRSDEPIAYEDDAALERLQGIADAFLGHNRRIHTRLDDSIVRVLAERPLVLRRARGFVPRSFPLLQSLPPVLALGGELKNTLCFLRDDRAWLSQHLGDLENVESCAAQATLVEHFRTVLELQPQIVAHDLHPDYHTTRYAATFSRLERVAVQHHHAHLASCLAENRYPGPALGVIFDGLGYGADGRIWGGEFLVGDLRAYRRVGHFDWLAMPGGDAATREPWRMALSLLVKVFGRDYPELPFLAAIPRRERELVVTMIERGVNAPLTSSCGRLFDAVAALAGVRLCIAYEGQAALELEMLATAGPAEPYPFEVQERDRLLVFSLEAMTRALVAELRAGMPPERISARFHRTLVALVVAVCNQVRRIEGVNVVALSGGVFQNRLLTGQVVAALTARSFQVLTHALVPPNDGGLSLGQAVVAGTRWAARSTSGG